MKKYSDTMNNKTVTRKRNAISVIASLICLLVLSILYVELLKHDLDSEKTRYGYIAKNEAEHIVTTIDCVMARTNTLKAMVQDHNGETSFFDYVAENIYRDVIDETGVTLKNFALAPGGVVSDVYPLKGNEALIGFDFLDTSRLGNLEAEEAYVEGRTILTNPFELIQGGMGMGGRAPVLIKKGGQPELWGLVTVTIDYDNLIEVLGLHNLQGMGVDYVLSYIDEDGSSHIMHAEGRLDDNAVKTRFNVRNLTWELAVSPEKGWISGFMVAHSVVIILLISGFVGLFTHVLLKLRDNNTMLLQLSNTDQLTGGLNRMSYGIALSELSKKPIDDDFVYISIDLNGLKQVNDTFGHLFGDELIRGASECLREALGDFGKAYRIGGDEFAALIHAEEKSLDGILEKLNALAKAWKGSTVKELSFSVGHASHQEFPEASMETLIKTADQRMYDAKREHYLSMGIDRRNQNSPA
ncbi:MAG: sensor domain-containing diguanylate cyclase [Lachnospiraceae bacterium]|nr:sensor domain-containing diguanylate cyclase [Lachnospiraceae bacterium]